MITTKPVVYLRSTENLDSFFKSIHVFDNLLRVFNVKDTVTEESEKEIFDNLLQTTENVVSLAKHLKGDYNLSYSRCYDLDTLKYKSHIQSPEVRVKNDLQKIMSENDSITIFDEDIGGGYLIRMLTDTFNDKGINVDVKTFIKFDPKTQEVLDLKDFLYNYSNSSGLVVHSGDTILRVPYMLSPDILSKFASIRPEYLESFGTFCWVLSYIYHATVSFNKTYQHDCYLQLTKVYKWNLPINTELMIEFCQEYLKLFF